MGTLLFILLGERHERKSKEIDRSKSSRVTHKRFSVICYVVAGFLAINIPFELKEVYLDIMGLLN